MGDWLDTLSREIVRAINKAVRDAPYDKTEFGIITGVAGSMYTVSVFGRTYQIESKKSFNVGEKVAVTAPQNNYKRLILNHI